MRLLPALVALLLAACGATTGVPVCSGPLPADRAGVTSGCLGYKILPDAQTYPQGAGAITFRVTATNVSTQPCGGPSNLSCGGPSLSVSAANGRQVWARTPPIVACPMLIRLLQPGESMSTQVIWKSPNLALGVYWVEATAGPDLGRSYFLVC